ncbi:MAG: glutathione S-transferase family protein [Cycloclasticus sp.]|nr:glutathione S-transferase family protein [Cycloclasticus sp.]MBQ0789879.1 glutathione S-transferase family protein [Cycloclasticus sp.]
MLKLYAYPRSRSTRVVWMLEEIGVDYEFIKIELLQGAGQVEAYLKIHADGKVPAIDDDGFVLTESAAIMSYIGDKYTDCNLLPEPKTQNRARYDEWCFFVLTELEQPLWTVGKHTFVLPEEKRVPEILDVAHWEFLKACKVLEKRLQGKEYALGDSFSAVDILIAHTLRWAHAFGVPSGSALLDAYREKMSARPAFERVMAKESAAS